MRFPGMGSRARIRLVRIVKRIGGAEAFLRSGIAVLAGVSRDRSVFVINYRRAAVGAMSRTVRQALSASIAIHQKILPCAVIIAQKRKNDKRLRGFSRSAH